MPRTPPTIVAPLPRDPRVMELAKTLNVSRREAYAAAIEAWAWMSMMERDGVVPDAEPDSLDGAVDITGMGQAMLVAGLVGVVNDGLVLPAELRHHERDERGGPAAAVRGDGQEVDPKVLRRRASNAVSARKTRRKNKLLGKKATPSGDKAWRTLGRVAGHEVRAYDGPHGCYAMVLGATIGGEPFRKLTVGDKAWSLESVRLTDALPGLVEKWRAVHQKENGRMSPVPLVPSYVDFRDDAERLTVLAKLAAEDARHADGDDASARQHDASASSAGPSAGEDADGERKSQADTGLDASTASADHHADALSSMSSLSKSSSSHEEEDIGEAGRQAAGDHERDQGNAEPEGIADWELKRQRQRTLAEKFAVALGEDVESILHRWKWNRTYLRSQLEAAGIDPNTGDAVAAGASSKPSQARADIPATTEPAETDGAAAGSVDARGGGEPDEDFEAMKDRLAGQLRGVAVAAAADVGVKYA